MCAAATCLPYALPAAVDGALQPEVEYRLSRWPLAGVSPDFSLVDFDGRPRTLNDYRGRVVVIFFGYARCPDVCPAELVKLALAMKKLGPASRHVQVLFVTLDPQRDTALILKQYVTAFDARFIGLTGTAAQIDRAAASFFIQYAKVPLGDDYAVSHTARLLVLDSAGHLRLVGAPQTSALDLAHDLAKLAME